MIKSTIYLSLILLASSTLVSAQETQPVTNATKWQLQEYSVQSLREMNPVFLNLGSFETIGQTFVGWNSTSGKFHRPQQPGESNQLNFISERYQQLNKVKLFGGFGFRQEWDKQITLSESLNPYRGNPYVAGDSLAGNWNKQWYDLKLDISSAPMLNDRLFIGAGLKYTVGTGARQEDPRPLALSKDLNLEPSASWKLNKKNTLGLKGLFGFYNEDISLEIKNPNSNHNLYKLLGPVDVFDVLRLTYVSTFNRNYKGNTTGASIQYAYENDKWLLAINTGLHKRTEDVRDGITNPLKAGRLNEMSYKAGGLIKKTTASAINKLEINWQQDDRDGLEFHQRLVSSGPTSSQLNETVFQSVFTTALQTNGVIKYSWLHRKNGSNFDWLLSGSAGFHGLDTRYLYPQNKQIADVMRYNLSAMRNWDNGKTSFSFQAKATLQQRITSTLNLAPSEGSSFVSDKLLYPDHAWLASEWIQPGFIATYSNKLSANTSWFIKTSGDFTLKTGNNPSYIPKGNRNIFQIAIGAFY